VDSSRSHDPRQSGVNWAASYPYSTDQPPRSSGPRDSSYRHNPTPVGPQSTYPYEQRAQQLPPRYEPQPVLRTPPKSKALRRFLGIVAFLALTAISLPAHIAAIFFIYVEFESPGDAATAALLIGLAFLGSFVALFLTGLLTQIIGAFPGRWRARVTFAALSGIIALVVAYAAASKLF
jgi:hypothetical protein